jgi:hypothetical protein
MKRPFNIEMIALMGLGAFVVGCMAYGLSVWKGRTIVSVRIERNYITVPESRIWVSAFEHRFTPEELEQVAKTNREGRDFALRLFACNQLTNHVRVLIKHGADTSKGAMEALRFSGMSNAASLIESLVSDLNRSSSNMPDASNSAVQLHGP